MGLPNILTDFETTLQQVGYIGVAKQITLPKTKKQTVSIHNSGMKMPVKKAIGYEEMEVTFTFDGLPKEAIALLKEDGETVIPLRAVGKYLNDNTNKLVDAVFEMQGIVTEFDPGDPKKGENTETKTMFNLHYCKLTMDGEEFEVDAMKPFAA